MGTEMATRKGMGTASVTAPPAPPQALPRHPRQRPRRPRPRHPRRRLPGAPQGELRLSPLPPPLSPVGPHSLPYRVPPSPDPHHPLPLRHLPRRSPLPGSRFFPTGTLVVPRRRPSPLRLPALRRRQTQLRRPASRRAGDPPGAGAGESHPLVVPSCPQLSPTSLTAIPAPALGRSCCASRCDRSPAVAASAP